MMLERVWDIVGPIRAPNEDTTVESSNNMDKRKTKRSPTLPGEGSTGYEAYRAVFEPPPNNVDIHPTSVSVIFDF